MTVIALINHTGKVGSVILNQLVKAGSQDHKLVVLHRPGSDVSTLPANIETRVLDLKDGTDESISEAIKGIEVIISALPSDATYTELKLITPLSKSESLKLFIPSDYGNHWTLEELSNPALGFLINNVKNLEAIKANNIPYALVKAGGFIEFVLGSPFAGIDVKGNKIQLYKGAESQPLNISTIPYIGTATANLALTPSPSSLNGKIYNFIQYTPTGQDLIQIFTNIHGTAPEVTEFTEADYETSMAQGGFGALAGAFKRKWGKGDWALQGSLEAGPGVVVEDLEIAVKRFA